MNRLAVFVEGYTEVVFVEKLIEEIAGRNDVIIEHREIRGGSRARRTMRLIKAARPRTDERFFVLILDCGGDEPVKARIREEHESLSKKGYSAIIGLRDVRPKFTHADVPKLEALLPRYIKTSLIPVVFILAIMEIEAWFLTESTHFGKIDPLITVAAIKATLGFDPENEDMEQRSAPADDLNNCYQIGGKGYVKHNAQDTVDALDYAIIYLEFPKKHKYVSRLVSTIDSFLHE
jgi:hypothetical protein